MTSSKRKFEEEKVDQLISLDPEPVVVELPVEKKQKEEPEETVIIKIDNNDSFILSRSMLTSQSKFIQTALEGDRDATELNFSSSLVPSDLFPDIVIYLTHHNKNRAELIGHPIKSKKLEDIIKDDWDFAFITPYLKKERISSLFKLIGSANYLEIPELLNLCAASFATLPIGIRPSEFPNTFGSEHDNLISTEKI